jgi:hypothetical protein
MRKAALAAGIAAAGLIFGYAGANAQSVYKPGVDVDADVYAGPYEYAPKPVGPRVYGYYYRAEPELFGRPQGPNGCGTYFYWNGERCVDARNKR